MKHSLMLDRSAITPEIEARFWQKVKKLSNEECWNWTGCIVHKYGQIKINGRPRFAHRVSMLIATGKWPSTGEVTDHLCGNQRCVNPLHLEITTQAQNLRRARTAALEARHGNH